MAVRLWVAFVFRVLNRFPLDLMNRLTCFGNRGSGGLRSSTRKMRGLPGNQAPLHNTNTQGPAP
jgi:hypothetical protein